MPSNNVIFSNTVYPIGNYLSPPVSIPAGDTRITLELKRPGWQALTEGADLVAIEIQRSWDNGATWIPAGGFTATGGLARDKSGNPLPEGQARTQGTWKLTPPINVSTLVRVSLSLLAELRTTGTLSSE